LTSEQLEVSRAERMRLNGLGALTFEDAKTWLEETGLCLFLPRRQYTSSVAPSFVEAVVGQRNPAPDPRQIAVAEDMLVRLEKNDIAVRLNLLGQPGEQPDFVVAAWVLPYVYALRGDRDWRRTPQLTGSRQVSPLAIQTYKLLEAGEATISQLKHALGREVTETAVLRAITELWQQLRIIPVISAPGETAKWQLLRLRFQKAIAEGASTSQVTAISVLASIYLQAVIAAGMEDVELFLAPLTARSKIREVLRGLVATRQVHTLPMGHAQHFYVAGTLPEFAQAPTTYASAATPASNYFLHSYEPDEEAHEPGPSVAFASPAPKAEPHTPRMPVSRKPAPAPKSGGARPHFSRTAAPTRDRKPAQGASNGRVIRRAGSEGRGSISRPGLGTRWSGNGGNHANGRRSGTYGARPLGNGARPAQPGAARTLKTSAVSRSNRTVIKAAGKSGAAAHASRNPALAAGAKAGNSKRYGFTARQRRPTKKRG
jgi:hypothetical protein